MDRIETLEQPCVNVRHLMKQISSETQDLKAKTWIMHGNAKSLIQAPGVQNIFKRNLRHPIPLPALIAYIKL